MNPAPIVITGCPRSGTQMMARVFGNLSEEFFLITEHGDKRNDVPEEKSSVEDHRLWWDNFEYQGWNKESKSPTIDVPIPEEKAIQRIREDYLRLAEGRRIVIKNPSHILYPQLVRQVFPDAKFVYCTRNPWHTMQSMIKHGHPRLLLLSPRAADPKSSLLLRAAIGWSDAFRSFQKYRDENWVVAEYSQMTDFPQQTISQVANALGIYEEVRSNIGLAATIPQPSRSNFYFIKHELLESRDRDEVLSEVKAGCEEFDYSLAPNDLAGTMVTYAIRGMVEKFQRKVSRQFSFLLS